MKKNTILLFAVFIVAMVVTSCNKTPLKSFHLTGSPELTITNEGGYTYFGIEANENDYWTVSTDVDWLEIKHTFGPGDNTSGNDDAVLMLYADRWIMNCERIAYVTVKGPGGEYTKTITQTPKPLSGIPITVYGQLPSEGGKLEIELPSGYWVTATCEANWLSILKCEEGLLIVTVDPSDGKERTTDIKILLSDDALLGTVEVTQK